MANRTKVLETLDQYFKEKGKILKSNEYARQTDMPIRLQQVRNIFGSWNRLEKLLMAREARYAPDPTTNVDEILAEENEKLLKEFNTRQEESEDLAAKVAEQTAANTKAQEEAQAAATPEGINALKAEANTVKKDVVETNKATTVKTSSDKKS